MNLHNVLLLSNGQRIYVSCVSKIYKNIEEGIIAIPEWQRFKNEERITELFNAYRDEPVRNGRIYPLQSGIVFAKVSERRSIEQSGASERRHVLYYSEDEDEKKVEKKVETKDKFYLIDGQHRYLALQKLFVEYLIDSEILVNIIPVATESDAYTRCRLLNNSMPLVLPENLKLFTLAKEITDRLVQKYFNFFSASPKPRRPHMNKDTLAQNLATTLGALQVDVDTVDTVDTVVGIIERVNHYYQSVARENHWELFFGNPDVIAKAYSKILEKKCDTKCFLGLFIHYEWLEKFKEAWYNPQVLQVKEKTSPKSNRISFTDFQRSEFWCQKVGPYRLKSSCFCCGAEVSKRAFHIGHNVAVHKGGTNDFSNLEILCIPCNLKMKTRSIDEYKTETQRLSLF